MEQCDASVASEGGGTATLVVIRPDGRKRFVFFQKGKGIGADLSQADGSQHFRATRKGDLYLIRPDKSATISSRRWSSAVDDF